MLKHMAKMLCFKIRAIYSGTGCFYTAFMFPFPRHLNGNKAKSGKCKKYVIWGSAPPNIKFVY